MLQKLGGGVSVCGVGVKKLILKYLSFYLLVTLKNKDRVQIEQSYGEGSKLTHKAEVLLLL